MTKLVRVNKQRIGNVIMLAMELGLLILPISLMLLGVIAPSVIRALPLSGLNGMTESHLQPSLRWRGWFDRSFQHDFSEWFSDNVGPAREIFIRVNNGIYAVMFKKTLENLTGDEQVIIGKDWTLYERFYIKDFCEKPDHEIDVTAIENLMRIAQEKLAAHHIALAIMISPSKAAIYPQFIPVSMCRTGESNERLYDRMFPLLSDNHLPIIDGHAMMVAARPTAAWPLFPHYGIHWNVYGMFPIAERLIMDIEAQLGRPLVHLSLKRVDVDDTPTGQDRDLATLLNLPIRLRYYPTPHAVLRRAKAGRPLHAIFIGSSFLWNVLDVLVDYGVVDRSYFYYYYSSVYRIDNTFAGKDHSLAFPVIASDPAATDLHDRLGAADAVIIEVNESNLSVDYLAKALRDLAAEADHLPKR